MPAVLFALLALLPQLVDRTNEALTPPPVSAELTAEKRADIFMARKMYREAVETYSSAINGEPDSARLYNKLGIAYHHQVLFNQARKQYERAVKIDKDYAEAINNLGTVYYAQRKYKKAAKTYEKALKYAPYSASIYSNLGTAHFARRQYKKASAAYLQALQLDPGVFEYRNSVGTVLQERSVQDRALYFYFVAKSYASIGLYDRALFHLRRALEDGYRKIKDIPKDPAFAGMLDNPEFQALINPPAPEQRAELQP